MSTTPSSKMIRSKSRKKVPALSDEILPCPAPPASSSTTTPAKSSDKKPDIDKNYKLDEEGTIGARIPVTLTKAQEHKSPYFPPGHLSILIGGRSGCGKSTLLRELIPQIALLKYVLICTKITNNPVNDAIKRYCENTLGPDGEPIVYGIAHNLEDATALVEETIDAKNELGIDCCGVIVLDDFSDYSSSRSNPMNVFIAKVFGMLRNYGFHNISITQNYTNFSTLARSNANIRFIYSMNDVHAVRSIANDFVGNTTRSKEDFNDLFRIVKDNEHAFLQFNSSGDDQRVFISIPGHPCRLVEFEDDGADILDDPKLDDLANSVLDATGKKGALSALDRRNYIRARERLDRYMDFIAQSRRISPDAVRDAVFKKYRL